MGEHSICGFAYGQGLLVRLLFWLRADGGIASYEHLYLQLAGLA